MTQSLRFPFTILGIDLATEPGGTGAVRLVVADRRARAEVVTGVLDDERLVALAMEVDVVGLDSPLGWPDAFVDAVTRHHSMIDWPPTDDPKQQRRLLSKRVTDRFVKQQTGVDVLSVSADRIGAVAMRAARFQAPLAAVWGTAASRDGSGRLLETYPAAALKRWALPSKGYKGKERVEERRRILADMRGQAPWLDVSAVSERCCESDHELDALVCTLVALAAKLGATYSPTNQTEEDIAAREGWIHLPTVSLRELGELLH